MRSQLSDYPALGRRLGLAALMAVSVAGILAAMAPPDQMQGDWERLMYLHVPTAWTAFVAFGVVAMCSAGYLISRQDRWDRCAAAAGEVGLACTALTLAVGAVWAHAVWGTWWAWDPRLVSTATLLCVYLAHAGVRALSPLPARAARLAAMIGIVGFADVPIVYFSVRWWRSLHQQQTFLAPDGGPPPIDAAMMRALSASLVAVLLVAAWAFLRRLRAPLVRLLEPVSGVPCVPPRDLVASGKGALK